MHVGGKFIAIGSAQAIGDSFDLNEVGYVPGYGTKGAGFVFGPNIYPEKYLYRFGFFIRGGIIKELDEKKIFICIYKQF